MRIYLDTEFNGFRGALISMALVTEDDRFWYEAVAMNDPIHPWVRENVIHCLGRDPLPSEYFRASLHEWILQFDNPEIICDWHSDAVHFLDWLDGPDFGSSLDFACRVTVLKTPPNAYVSDCPHNAVEDARALRRWHMGIPNPKGIPGYITLDVKPVRLGK